MNLKNLMCARPLSQRFRAPVRCDDEVNMVPADVSPYVQWKNDEHNQFE